MQLYWKILMTHDIWINKMAQNEIFYNLRSRFSMYEIQMSTIHVDIHFLFSSAWPRGRATSMVQLIRELKHKLKVLPVLMSFSIFRLGFQRSNVSPKTAKSGNFQDQRWQVSWINNSGIRSQRTPRLCSGLLKHQLSSPGHTQLCLHHDVMKHNVTVQFSKPRLAPHFSPTFLSLIFMALGTQFTLYIT